MKQYRISRSWIARLLAFQIVSFASPSIAEDNATAQPLEQQTPSVQLWSFKEIHDAFVAGSSIYLDVSMADGSEWLWDPRTGNRKPKAATPLGSFNSIRFIPEYHPETLSNGASIVLTIESTTPRCGYTIGVEYHYAEENKEPASFFLIERYAPPKRTNYCGTPLKQRYDADIGGLAVGLADKRLLFIDLRKRQAFAIMHVPTSVVALDSQSFLVPAAFLRPGLDAAGDDQRARYRALLAALKNHPAVTVHATPVE